MKRLIAVAVVAAALALGMSVVSAGSASAASVCFNYDSNINGTQQAGSQCLPG